MKPTLDYAHCTNEKEALKLQAELASLVIKENCFGEINLIAGVDVAYHKESDLLVAAVVVLNAETLEVIETQTAEGAVQFPYIPGLFSFRELPPLIDALEKLQHTPDLIICDGQGLAHPRRFGLACHLGVLFDIPTIGCGKSRLLGEHSDVDGTRGSTSPLIDNGQVIGSVLRTQNGINPIYVSIGHKVSLETANKWVLKAATQYRLPETTRQADQKVNDILKYINS